MARLLSDFHDLNLVLGRKVNLDPMAELLAGAGGERLSGHHGTEMERSIREGRQFHRNLVECASFLNSTIIPSPWRLRRANPSQFTTLG